MRLVQSIWMCLLQSVWMRFRKAFGWAYSRRLDVPLQSAGDEEQPAAAQQWSMGRVY